MDHSVAQFALAAALLTLGALIVERLRFPALPAYLLVGLAIGHRLEVDVLEPLPSLGLLLLLFSVGLEFGPDRLAGLSGRVLWAGLIDAVPLLIGTFLGLAVGLDLRHAVLLGGVIYISSSAVVAKLIIDLRRAAYPESEVVLGVLVFEDFVIAFVLALFGGEAGVVGLVWSLGLVLLYLLLARFLPRWVVPILEKVDDELLLLLGTAFTTGTAVLFHMVGASEGIGAFLAGVIAAALALRDRIEHLFSPVRDLAVAFFFLTVGAQTLGLLSNMTWVAGLLVVLAFLLKLIFDFVAGLVAGLRLRESVLTAFYLVPRGEFNLVLGALALSHGVDLAIQVAVLSVLIGIPVGAALIRFGPQWTKPLQHWTLRRRVRRRVSAS